MSKGSALSSGSKSSRRLVVLSLAVIGVAATLVYKFLSSSSMASTSSSVPTAPASSRVVKMSSVDVLAGGLPLEVQGKDDSHVQEKFISVKVTHDNLQSPTSTSSDFFCLHREYRYFIVRPHPQSHTHIITKCCSFTVKLSPL